MTEIANFKIQPLGGADVATILDNESETLEVLRLADGNFELIIHNRRFGESDKWDDLSVMLKPQHFAVLGSIAGFSPVATVINDNQPGKTAIIEIIKSPPTLAVGTMLYEASEKRT